MLPISRKSLYIWRGSQCKGITVYTMTGSRERVRFADREEGSASWREEEERKNGAKIGAIADEDYAAILQQAYQG